jgi:hypothetical protein
MGFFDIFKKPEAVRDLHGRMKAIEDALRGEGLAEWAERLDDTVAAASTGLELHMGARHVLGELRRAQVGSRGVLDQVAQLADDLDKALR